MSTTATTTHHKPNPHPYAIKTTSTGILSRSNSTSHNLNYSSHFYVPPSPSASSRSRSPQRPTSAHNYDISTSNPSPLPPPPTREAENEDPDPRLWPPDRLASHLETCNLHDVAQLVTRAQISGKSFLRWSQDDLDAMELPPASHGPVLAAARSLRRSNIHKRIWGNHSVPSTPTAANDGVFDNPLYASSTSSVDLTAITRSQPLKNRVVDRNGRVRGMVQTLERSGSVGGSERGSPSPTRRYRNTSPAHSVSEQEYATARSESSSHSRHSTPSPPETDADRTLGHDQEPSIEELLAQSGDGNKPGSWGARAWMDGPPGVTVKHVPSSQLQEERGRVVSREQGSARGWGRSKGKKTSGAVGEAKEERRVVTAIFVPHAPENGNGEQNGEEIDAAEHHNADGANTLQNDMNAARTLSDTGCQTELIHDPPTAQAVDAPLESDQQQSDARLSALTLELHTARALIDVLRARIEVLERQVPAPTPTNATPPVPKNDKRSKDHARDVMLPARVSALPGYVLLVGLGVCAVVLRVLLRRVVGVRWFMRRR